MTLYFTTHTPLAISILAPTAIMEWSGGAGAEPFRHTFHQGIETVQHVVAPIACAGVTVDRGVSGITTISIYEDTSREN